MDASNNKWSPFAIKEIKFSKGCNMNSIRAKFSHGILFIAMPKEARESFHLGERNKEREYHPLKLQLEW